MSMHDDLELMLELRPILKDSGLAVEDSEIESMIRNRQAAHAHQMNYRGLMGVEAFQIYYEMLKERTAETFQVFIVEPLFDSYVHKMHDEWWLLRRRSTMYRGMEHWDEYIIDEGWVPSDWRNVNCPASLANRVREVLEMAGIDAPWKDMSEARRQGVKFPRGLPSSAILLKQGRAPGITADAGMLDIGYYAVPPVGYSRTKDTWNEWTIIRTESFSQRRNGRTSTHTKREEFDPSVGSWK